MISLKMWNLKKTHAHPKLIEREGRLVAAKGEGSDVEVHEGGLKI